MIEKVFSKLSHTTFLAQQFQMCHKTLLYCFPFSVSKATDCFFNRSDNRPAIIQALCLRLPAFQFYSRLTGIDDNIAGNFVKIQADFIFLNVHQRRTLTWNIPPFCYCVILAWSYLPGDFLLDSQMYTADQFKPNGL